MKFPLQVRCALIFMVVAAAGPGPDLYAQIRGRDRVITAQTSVVWGMKFSPDGRLVAIARGLAGGYQVELWNTETGALQRTIEGFDGPVFSVSFSPDGRTLLTGSSGVHRDKPNEKRTRSWMNAGYFAELKWWDLQTGEFKQRFQIPGDNVYSVTAAYSPDGKFLAASDVSYNGGMAPKSTLRVLDAATGKSILKLKEDVGFRFPTTFEGSMMAKAASNLVSFPRWVVRFSPDGKVVAAWNEKEIRLWDSVSGKEALKLAKIKGHVKGISFSPDGSSLAVSINTWSTKNGLVYFQSELRVWEIATGTEKQVVPLRTPVATGPTFAPNGRQLLVAGFYPKQDRSYPSMELVDLEKGSGGSIYSVDDDVFSAIELSHDGRLMAFQTGVSTVKLVDTQGWTLRFTCDANADSTSSGRSFNRRLVSVKSVPAVTFLADGIHVAGEVESGGIKVWDVRTGEVKKVFGQDAETGSIAEISSNGDVVAEITDDEKVRVWNVRTGVHAEIPDNKSPAVAIAVSGNGQILAIATANQISLFNLQDAKIQPLSAPIQGSVVCVTLSFDGRFLAGANAQGEVQLWGPDNGTVQKHFPAGFGVSTLRFTPRSDALAIGGKDGRISLWNLQSGAMVFESKKHSAMVNAIAFSADAKLMATGSDDRTAIIWEVEGGKARRTLKGHDFTVTSVSFSPGNDLLAAGSANASVAVWDVATGKLDRMMR